MTPEVQTIEAQPTLGIRVSVRQAEIGETVGRLLPKVLAAAGDDAAGPVLARWHHWENDAGEMELAVPVRAARPATGECRPGALPGGRAVVADYVGSYEGLPAAWATFKQWMTDHGHTTDGDVAPWEAYLSDCSVTPAEELVTRIVWPLPEPPAPTEA